MRRALLFALALVAAGSLACAGDGKSSLYDKTYQAEMDKLESQAAREDAAEAAAHAEARKYAAVVYFPVGSSQLTDEGKHELRWFVDKIQPFPKAQIQVQGFADVTGSETGNQKLAYARAEAVSGYLAIQGIDASRLRTEGFSSQFPAESNATAEGRKRNRRVEVTVR